MRFVFHFPVMDFWIGSRVLLLWTTLLWNFCTSLLMHGCKNVSWLQKLLGRRVCTCKYIFSPKLGFVQLLNFDRKRGHGLVLHFTDYVLLLAKCFSLQGNLLLYFFVLFLIVYGVLYISLIWILCWFSESWISSVNS